MTTSTTFLVKFEDGKTAQLTPKQIDELKDKRRWIVVDSRNRPILKKIYRG